MWHVSELLSFPLTNGPTASQDLDLRTMAKMVCSILDIPVFENPVESLHVLFSLYLELKAMFPA